MKMKKQNFHKKKLMTVTFSYGWIERAYQSQRAPRLEGRSGRMKTPIVFLDTLGPQLLAAAVKLPSEISSRFWSDVENFSDVTSLCFTRTYLISNARL